ncbi:MAG: hypothetical protein F6K42_27260 [Leptolyngbya sp. SIO1D8]|nr:hypothetical protein [Leptolyngbya sp. SIO1D8]
MLPEDLIPLDMAAGLEQGFRKPYQGWALKHGLDVNSPLTWEMFRNEMLYVASLMPDGMGLSKGEMDPWKPTLRTQIIDHLCYWLDRLAALIAHDGPVNRWLYQFIRQRDRL